MHTNYEKRLLRVLDYVFDNLDGDISLDKLADVAALSRFHFHRVFASVTGETVVQFTRRIRLARASFDLLQSDRNIDVIAARCGYSNPRSFSQSFRTHFGVTPSQFRARAVPLPPLQIQQNGDFDMFDVTVENLPERAIVGVPHVGDYMEIGRQFEAAMTSVMAQGGGAKIRGMIGLYEDDPKSKPLDELQSFAGVLVSDSAGFAAPLQEKTLVAGRYGVLRYVGPYPGLKTAYDYMFGEWLPKSGHVPRDQPPYELYENSPQDTQPEDLVTLICVALQ